MTVELLERETTSEVIRQPRPPRRLPRAATRGGRGGQRRWEISDSEMTAPRRRLRRPGLDGF